MPRLLPKFLIALSLFLAVLFPIFHLPSSILPIAHAAETPRRIVSLAPSMTEMLYALGLGENIVGVTSYCDYPEEAKKKPKIGGMSNPSLEAVVSLKPDIVMMTTDGNPKEFEERLLSLKIKTYVFRARTLAGLPGGMREMGTFLGKKEKAETIAAEIEETMSKLRIQNPVSFGDSPGRELRTRKRKVLFIVWPEPLIVAGPGTAIDDAITLLGHDNIASKAKTTYPKYSIEEVIRRSPDVIFIGRQMGQDISEVSNGLLKKINYVPAVKNKKVFYVSDSLYRPGPRVIKGIEELAGMSKMKIASLILVSALICLSALFIGPRIISPFGTGGIEREILFSIRLPRVVVALLMGIALGASGAVLQGVLRNPLADPYILGISSGASLSAALALISGIYTFGRFTIPLTAFIGALTVTLLVGVFGWRRGGLWPERLLLAGVGLSFLFHAVLMLLTSVSTDEGLRRAVLWMFGDLAMADWSLVPYGLIFIVSGLVISVSRSRALNALILGDEFAHSLGFSVHKERFFLFISMALMTATSVSLGGTIGFIGLLIPHIMRFVVGADSRILIPVSAIGGGAFLCLADLIGRSIVPPMEIPSGIITAIIGSPYFLYLLRRKDVLSV